MGLYQDALKKRKSEKSGSEGPPPKLMKRPAAAPKTACKAKAKAKAKSKAKSKAASAEEPAEEPVNPAEHVNAAEPVAASAEEPAAAPKAACKAKAKAKAKVVWSTRPPLPEPCSGTTYYLQGKVHRNTSVFRVFRKASDRVDLKVKVDPEPSVGWSRCLDIIEEAAKKEEQKAEADESKDVD